MTTDWRRFMAVHEAGHAIVAMYLGMDIVEIKIDVPAGECEELPKGGGFCEHIEPRHIRSHHACSSLAGVLACAIHCRDFEDFEELNNWDHCSEDMRLFNERRGGMSYRTGRRYTLWILQEMQKELLEIAAVLERDGYMNHSNSLPQYKATDG